MHVALVTAAFPEPRPGRYPGIERLARELTDALLATGVEVTILTTLWNGGAREGRHGRARILRLPDTSRRVGRVAALGDSHYWSWGSAVGRALRSVLPSDRPDVIHALSPVSATPGLVRSGMPVVTTFHHYEGLRHWSDWLYKPFHRILEYRSYLASTLVTTPSRASAEVLKKTYGVPLSRIRVVPWGVDLARFRPEPHPPNPDFEVLFIGPHEPRKGIVYLLQAIAILRDKGMRVHLTTVGKGSQLLQLQALSGKLGIADCVTFRGFLDDSEDRGLRRRYAEADVFAFPSLQEGFGFVLAEAMAAGLPVVASNVSAMPEVVGDAGILVPARDSKALAAAIQQLAQAPQLRSELAALGRQRAESMFAWDRTAAQLLAVYEEGIGATRSR